MMARSRFILTSHFSQLQNLLSNFLLRNHADVGTNSQAVSRRTRVTVESSAVKENKVTCLIVYFNHIAQRLNELLLFRYREPIFVVIHSIYFFEELLVIIMRFGDAYESTSIFVCICQSHYSLVAPQVIFCRRLISMQGSAKWSLFELELAIHEAEAIEGCFELLSFPYFLKDNFRLLSEFPLGLRMSYVLNHASVEQRRIIVFQGSCLFILPINFSSGQSFHDCPKLLYIV